MKKVICFTIILAMAISLAACNTNSQAPAQTSGTTLHQTPETGYSTPAGEYMEDLVTLKVTVDGEEEARYHGGSFDHVLEKHTAAELTEVCLGDGRMAYTVKDGLYDGFDGLNAKGTMAWLLYINGELADVGADELIVKTDDEIMWRYTDYTKALPKQG